MEYTNTAAIAGQKPIHPRLIANDLHEDLTELLYVLHCMDCISFSNCKRGHASDDLDHESLSWIALIGQDYIDRMKVKIEQLRRCAND